jgi:signal transduction histidine kinase
MSGSRRKSLVLSLSLRAWVALWVGCALLVWFGLVAGWFVARDKLARIDQRVTTDVDALGSARDLERAILAERREDLLWAATHQVVYRDRRDAYLLEAETIAAVLNPFVTSPEEGALVLEIRRQLAGLREMAVATDSFPLESTTAIADQLLATVDRFQAQNSMQMQESMQVAGRVRSTVSNWAIGLSIGTAVLLLAGSTALLRRVLRPTMSLVRSAEAFGKGDMEARAVVLHEDELGELARTFNNMAEDIARRDKNRRHFVAAVVHDIKNPVMTIRMAMNMLGAALGDSSKQTRYADAILHETKRLDALARDLMENIRVTTGNLKLNSGEVELCGLAQRLVQNLAETSPDREITVESNGACVVMGDVDRLERVIVNLLTNAVKYTSPDSGIIVRIEEQAPNAVFTVSDHGPGISEEDLKIIFQPFGRGLYAHGIAKGAGMGLYVVKQIVDAHGGAVSVQSVQGEGTTVRVELPLA